MRTYHRYTRKDVAPGLYEGINTYKLHLHICRSSGLRRDHTHFWTVEEERQECVGLT